MQVKIAQLVQPRPARFSPALPQEPPLIKLGRLLEPIPPFPQSPTKSQIHTALIPNCNFLLALCPPVVDGTSQQERREFIPPSPLIPFPSLVTLTIYLTVGRGDAHHPLPSPNVYHRSSLPKAHYTISPASNPTFQAHPLKPNIPTLFL